MSCGGKAYGPVTITVPSSNATTPAAPIIGIPAGAVCTVTETDKPNAGPHASWEAPIAVPAQVTIVSSTPASIRITNTRTYTDPGPPEPCTNPTVTIAPTSTSGVAGQTKITVDFTGTSSGTPTSWLWDFDDTASADTPSAASHEFIYTKTRGNQTWRVTLTVTTGPTCSGKATATVTLNP